MLGCGRRGVAATLPSVSRAAPVQLTAPARGSRALCTPALPPWRLRNKNIIGKSTGVYGSKLDINTVRDLPGGYMLTGRRDSERQTETGKHAAPKEVFLVTGACGQVRHDSAAQFRAPRGKRQAAPTAGRGLEGAGVVALCRPHTGRRSPAAAPAARWAASWCRNCERRTALRTSSLRTCARRRPA